MLAIKRLLAGTPKLRFAQLSMFTAAAVLRLWTSRSFSLLATV